MKKIINGKVYDTDTAHRCGEYEPNPYKNDFHWYIEKLYQKKTGEFFLYGQGNAASKYSRSCGLNEWSGGEKIIPLSYDSAREWAEQHLDGDDYIAIFGEPVEDDNKTRLNLYISTALAAKLKTEAAKQNISIGDYLETIIK